MTAANCGFGASGAAVQRIASRRPAGPGINKERCVGSGIESSMLPGARVYRIRRRDTEWFRAHSKPLLGMPCRETIRVATTGDAGPRAIGSIQESAQCEPLAPAPLVRWARRKPPALAGA